MKRSAILMYNLWDRPCLVITSILLSLIEVFFFEIIFLSNLEVTKLQIISRNE